MTDLFGTIINASLISWFFNYTRSNKEVSHFYLSQIDFQPLYFISFIFISQRNAIFILLLGSLLMLNSSDYAICGCLVSMTCNLTRKKMFMLFDFKAGAEIGTLLLLTLFNYYSLRLPKTVRIVHPGMHVNFFLRWCVPGGVRWGQVVCLTCTLPATSRDWNDPCSSVYTAYIRASVHVDESLALFCNPSLSPLRPSPKISQNLSSLFLSLLLKAI